MNKKIVLIITIFQLQQIVLAKTPQLLVDLVDSGYFTNPLPPTDYQRKKFIEAAKERPSSVQRIYYRASAPKDTAFTADYRTGDDLLKKIGTSYRNDSAVLGILGLLSQDEYILAALNDPKSSIGELIEDILYWGTGANILNPFRRSKLIEASDKFDPCMAVKIHDAYWSGRKDDDAKRRDELVEKCKTVQAKS